MILFEMPGGDTKDVVEARVACLKARCVDKARGDEILRWLKASPYEKMPQPTRDEPTRDER